LKYEPANATYPATPSIIANIIPIGAQGRDSNLNELNDVTITSPVNNQLLRYNSGIWENWTPNFLTTVPTLDQVTTAGNTTTNAITVGGLTVATNLIYTDTVNGRVGIGTNTPLTTLHSEGSIRIGGTTTGVSLSILGSGGRGGTISPRADGFSIAGLVFSLTGLTTGDFRFAGTVSPSSNFGQDLGNEAQVWNFVYARTFRGRNNTAEGTTNLFSGTTSNPLILGIGGTENMRFSPTNGNVLINTTTDAGFKLDVNGTARINSSLYVTNPAYTNFGRFYQAGNSTTIISGGPAGENITFGPTNRIFINAGQTRVSSLFQIAGGLSVGTWNYPGNYGAQAYIGGSTTANAGGGRGLYIDSTIVAAANNDVLVGLDINPTFTNGAFTGVKNYALRSYGDIRLEGNNVNLALPGSYTGISMNSGSALLQKVYLSYTDPQKTTLNVTRFIDHNDGAVDVAYGIAIRWDKRQSSNVSLSAGIDSSIVYNSGSSGSLGQVRGYNLKFNMSEGSTVSSPFIGYDISSAVKGSTGTISSFIGYQVTDNSVSNTIYGFRSLLNSGAGKWGLYFDGTANNYLNGNVLIGTTTDAGYKLDVNGTIRSNNAIYASQYRLTAYPTYPLLYNSGSTIILAAPTSSGSLNFNIGSSGTAKINGSSGGFNGAINLLALNRTYTSAAGTGTAHGIKLDITFNETGGAKSYVGYFANYIETSFLGTTGNLIQLQRDSIDRFIVNRNGQAFLPTLTAATQINQVYYDSATGELTYGAVPAVGGGGAQFVIDYDYNIIGVKDGSNVLFTTSATFIVTKTRVYLNGQRLTRGVGYDYVETGTNQITFAAAPVPSDQIIIEYEI
jgi:hypothetical protein